MRSKKEQKAFVEKAKSKKRGAMEELFSDSDSNKSYNEQLEADDHECRAQQRESDRDSMSFSLASPSLAQSKSLLKFGNLARAINSKKSLKQD